MWPNLNLRLDLLLPHVETRAVGFSGGRGPIHSRHTSLDPSFESSRRDPSTSCQPDSRNGFEWKKRSGDRSSDGNRKGDDRGSPAKRCQGKVLPWLGHQLHVHAMQQ